MAPSKSSSSNSSEKVAISNREWTPQVEIDLLMLMLTIKNAGSNHDWDAMPEKMAKLNWEFSREGLRKHFQARMVKAFQVKCNEGGLVIIPSDDAAPSRNQKKGASSPRKKTGSAKASEGEGSTADGMTADRSTADRSTADRSTADRSTADRSTADRSTADGSTADDKTPKAQTAPGKKRKRTPSKKTKKQAADEEADEKEKTEKKDIPEMEVETETGGAEDTGFSL